MLRIHWNEKQEGIVLLLALVALLLISAVGASLLFMATATTTIVGAQRASARAFHAAMGGLEEGRYRLLPGLLTGAPGGLNYMDTTATGAGGNPQPIIPCGPFELAGTMVPCSTSGLPVAALPGGGPRPESVLYIVNSAALVVPTDDDDLANDIPGAIATVTGTLQANPGTTEAVPWNWIRVNLKTELASGEDIDMSGAATNQNPVFIYMGRQYNYDTLAAWDTNIDGTPGDVLPYPWGPDPAAPPGGGQPIIDRPCVHFICASPVYMLTAKIVTVGTRTSRVVRMEVASQPALSIDASLYSDPNISIGGALVASGRDMCDVDCGPAGEDFTWASRLAADGFGPQMAVGNNCRTVPPLQSAQNSCPPMGPCPNGNRVTSAVSITDPGPFDVDGDGTIDLSITADWDGDGNPDLDASGNPISLEDLCERWAGSGECATNGSSGSVASQVPKEYNIDQLIDALLPGSTMMTTDGVGYYPGNIGNITCNAAGCRGNGAQMGGFPLADPIQGTGVDPVTTYVPGDLDCRAGCLGAGILIVNGDFQVNAGFAFWGVIIVRGSVSVAGGAVGALPGGINCNVYGALLAGGAVTTSINGGICFQYNSCAQRNSSLNTPPFILAFREIPEN